MIDGIYATLRCCLGEECADMIIASGSGLHVARYRDADCRSGSGIGIESDGLGRLIAVGAGIIEFARQIKLIVSLARQTDDVRHTGCKREIIVPVMLLSIIRVVGIVVTLVAVSITEEWVAECVIHAIAIGSCIGEESLTRTQE